MSFVSVVIVIFLSFIVFIIGTFYYSVIYSACLTDPPKFQYLDRGILAKSEEEDCDLISKQLNVYVYLSDQRHRDWKLVFQYDPVDFGIGPDITSAPDGSIHISLPSVSSILFQETEYSGIKIDYQIGKVYLP